MKDRYVFLPSLGSVASVVVKGNWGPGPIASVVVKGDWRPEIEYVRS